MFIHLMNGNGSRVQFFNINTPHFRLMPCSMLHVDEVFIIIIIVKNQQSLLLFRCLRRPRAWAGSRLLIKFPGIFPIVLKKILTF